MLGLGTMWSLVSSETCQTSSNSHVAVCYHLPLNGVIILPALWCFSYGMMTLFLWWQNRGPQRLQSMASWAHCSLGLWWGRIMMGEEYVVGEATTPLEEPRRSPSRYPQSPNFLPLGPNSWKKFHYLPGEPQAGDCILKMEINRLLGDILDTTGFKKKRPRKLNRLFFKEDI